eukprot:GHVU01204693.1.p2 GENE.GHVU01204693.1~~GHVU01204693.1.p2  ORF type:complete len:107 (-),score=7.62 GHVU01204693.1:607-927(-)
MHATLLPMGSLRGWKMSAACHCRVPATVHPLHKVNVRSTVHCALSELRSGMPPRVLCVCYVRQCFGPFHGRRQRTEEEAGEGGARGEGGRRGEERASVHRSPRPTD